MSAIINQQCGRSLLNSLINVEWIVACYKSHAMLLKRLNRFRDSWEHSWGILDEFKLIVVHRAEAGSRNFRRKCPSWYKNVSKIKEDKTEKVRRRKSCGGSYSFIFFGRCVCVWNAKKDTTGLRVSNPNLKLKVFLLNCVFATWMSCNAVPYFHFSRILQDSSRFFQESSFKNHLSFQLNQMTQKPSWLSWPIDSTLNGYIFQIFHYVGMERY